MKTWSNSTLTPKFTIGYDYLPVQSNLQPPYKPNSIAEDYRTYKAFGGRRNLNAKA
jgi:hypothetical protein